MLASSWMDPVLGVDIHIVAVPSPAGPVPTPLPHPFIGMVFDPMGAAVGAAISTALGAGPTMTLVNSMPATNCGTEVMAVPPHIPMPPGVAHPKPPDNDAELMFGGMQGGVEGSFGVRLGDIALSCGDPVRMPTSTVLAVPKGAPVMNMKPMAPDLATIAMAGAMKAGMKGLGAAGRGLRGLQRSSKAWKRASDAIKNKLDAVTPQRMRGLRDRAVCFVTGHPVDVATGRMFTELTDLELPGPLPLKFARAYDTSFSWRDGVMGRGWSHTLESSLWLEPGKVVLRAEDGRELEFSTLEFKDRVMRDGQSLFDPVYRMTLKCTGPMRFEVQEISGVVHKYEPVPGGDPSVAQRVQKRDRSGFHLIEYHYDKQGRVEWVRDCGGRLVGLEYDKNGRLSALKVPLAKGHGHRIHRRFFYGKDGDLERVEDSLGHSWKFDYVDHLMVQETDRTGLSFYFQYDGFGAGAKCVRTWGDGGIYDHVISYTADNKKTIVEDSLGAVTIYEMDEKMQVISITDPMGGTGQFVYDSQSGQVAAEVSPVGDRKEMSYDVRGNLTSVTSPDGSSKTISYDERFDLPSLVQDSIGRAWEWRYDEHGRIRTARLPNGEAVTYTWSEEGMLEGIQAPGQRRTGLRYDEQKCIKAAILPNGAEPRYQHDGQGRVVKTQEAGGAAERFSYNTESRITEHWSLAGFSRSMVYDAELNLIEAKGSGQSVKFSYAHYHRLTAREEAGTRLQFEYDTEDQLRAVVNESSERYEFALDPCGRVIEENGFDGASRRYQYDLAGRLTRSLLPSGRQSSLKYDEASRIVGIEHDDGTAAEFEYDEGGRLVRAQNESSDVLLEYDVLGRIVAESQDGGETWIKSSFAAGGERVRMESDLGARQLVEVDARGELAALVHGGTQGNDRSPERIEFQRDSFGRELGRRLPGGVEISWTRAADGRPLGRRTTRRSPGAASATDTVLDERTYQWRADDQISEIASSWGGPTTYEHDARGRLIRQRGPAQHLVERAMDAVSNVYRTESRSERRYGPGGVLLEEGDVRFEHDEDGNRTRRIEPDGSEWRYRWNGAGMLTEVERPDGHRVRFTYDAFARRVSKTLVECSQDGSDEQVKEERRFAWDGHQLVHEITSDQDVVTWYWEPDTFAPVLKEQAGRTHAVATDHMGTPTEMYDEAGELAWRAQLDVFGVPSVDVGAASDCPWRWPGQYEDPETGAYYNRHRYYDGATYLSQDPLRLGGGFRLYGYPEASDLFSDPFGLSGGYWHPQGVWITRGGNPVFDSLHDVRLPKDMRASDVSDYRQMTYCTENLRSAIDRGKVDANLFTKQQMEAIAAGQDRIPGLTWHHHENGSLMQLVDRETHSKVGHDGGRKKVGGRC